MPSIHEEVSKQFASFATAGCGWKVFPKPVLPEPPLPAFAGYRLPTVVDDGRVSTLGSSFVSKLSRLLGGGPPQVPPAEPEPTPEPEPTALCRESPLVELQTALPANLDIKHDAFSTFLAQLGVCSGPLAFELVGTPEQIVAQFAAEGRDTPFLKRQLGAYFPDVAFLPCQGTMEHAWSNSTGETFVIEFGLEQEFIQPLLTGGKLDPFVGLIGAMGDLAPGEFAIFQVLFQQTARDWKSSIARAVNDGEGKPLFSNRPDLAIHAKQKLSSPLYGVVIRLAARAPEFDRTWGIVRELAFALRVFSSSEGNSLVPLKNDEYPHEEHCLDMLRRQSRRSGMILNAEELMGFVHFPSPIVRSSKLRRQVERTKAAPVAAIGGSCELGENTHMGITTTVGLSPDQRVRHVHLLGATSTGKSTLLFNLIRQDIERGGGLAVLDPHGDLIDRILGIIPPERIGDVVLVDPSDEEYSVGFNILSAHSDLEKTILASDLVSVFQRLSTSWGDQMGSVLSAAIRAFLESTQGGTLADLRRFLIEPSFRERFLETVQDPDLVYYWRKAFKALPGNKSIGPVLTRLETFLSPKPIRYMVSQPENRLDFSGIMDSGKILLAKLSQGQMGKENSFLMGSLLMAKFQQAAMSRQRMESASRRDFFLYVDEFHNFITPSMAEILSGARKYSLGLVLAHQELRQLERDREVASAVMSNPYTRVVFRVGDDDARKLESGFSYFEARDLQNLETGQAICRIEKADGDFNLAVPLPSDPDPATASANRRAVIEASRRRYATPRATIEAGLVRRTESDRPEKEQPAPKAPEPASIPEKPVATALRTIPTPEAPQVPPAPPVVPREPADLGRGGEQHITIQKRLKQAAERIGYIVTAEKPVLDGAGSVDLALESKLRSIAVEITVTTTIDHEVGNVSKCLKANFQSVAVVSSSAAKLRQMEEAVAGALGPELAARVGYFTPDQFLAHLESLAKEDAAAAPAKPSETTRRGWQVKRSAPKLTPEELKAKEAAALKMLADAMKHPPDSRG